MREIIKKGEKKMKKSRTKIFDPSPPPIGFEKKKKREKKPKISGQPATVKIMKYNLSTK